MKILLQFDDVFFLVSNLSNKSEESITSNLNSFVLFFFLLKLAVPVLLFN